MSKEVSFPKSKVKILLLEGIHSVAYDTLKDAGYSVEGYSKSLKPEELLEAIGDIHILGIRSKTNINADHFKAARRLLAVGCFGVGTNQVDLTAARQTGTPVFNAPYGNTRSVAELAIGNVIFLARKAADKSAKIHQGHWDKSAKDSHEVRGKTLGIVGYGHIGQQVAILAEALGLHVVFYDKTKRLAIGNARELSSLGELLEQSDFVSLHVPAMPGGRPLIGEDELGRMKKGSYLLNLSRGSLIDFEQLKKALESGHLAGAAIDVYPSEPKTNNEPFECVLAGVENAILTPHLGGSTEEAQHNIGKEVAKAFAKFLDSGSTLGAVNFPQVELPADPKGHRILNIHRNEPGVLRDVNRIISDIGANINAQYLNTYKDVGYLIMDINKEMSSEVKNQIAELPTNIRTRILF